MKICVISSYAWIKVANNYGALLQYYALQNYLNQRGHRTFWLRIATQRNLFYHLLCKIKRFKSLYLVAHFYKCHKLFCSFIDKYLFVSPIVYSNYESLEKNVPKADIYISGSDQVWGGKLKENYLLFVKDNSIKIAYAASFGKKQLEESHIKIIEPWIRQFQKVSVRESDGVEICKQMGIDAQQLLDPTFLINNTLYPTRAPLLNVKYYFCYFLNINNLKNIHWSEIENYAIQHNKKLIVSAIQGAENLFDRDFLVFPSPTEWLTYYKYSDFIFTNTFHGTTFSLIYHRPFIVILQEGEFAEQNCRILSLLELFNMENRIWNYNTPLIDLISNPIDWEKYDRRIEELRERTDFFFKDIGL